MATPGTRSTERSGSASSSSRKSWCCNGSRRARRVPGPLRGQSEAGRDGPPNMYLAEPVLQPAGGVLQCEVEHRPGSTSIAPNALPPMATSRTRSSDIHDLPTFGGPGSRSQHSESTPGTAHFGGANSMAMMSAAVQDVRMRPGCFGAGDRTSAASSGPATCRFGRSSRSAGTRPIRSPPRK